MTETARRPGRARTAHHGSGQLLGPTDLYLFNEGTHRSLGERLGAHLIGPPHPGAGGEVAFAVWAPNARAVSVVGDFNGWDAGAHPMASLASSGVWRTTVPDAEQGQVYKYAVTAADGRLLHKADPFAWRTEEPPSTGSVIWHPDHRWEDGQWMARRAARIALDAPVSVYEVHLGSWRRDPAEPDRLLSYREIAPMLVEHVSATGFTHVELMPVMEHPFYGSWGYQTTGYFAPSARYGPPEDFMALVDALHRADIGVILDWVPSHFPSDEFALADFDGTHLFEHADPRLGFHPDWHSLVFNYGRLEVRSFLASSAEHWLTNYHADGLRVDAVASMLYRDYSRKAGEWIANQYGGRENLEAISFLQQLNTGVYADHPDVHTLAEESTAWPGVSRPVDAGGLGFGYKWDMGWMHDTLEYFQCDPVHRRWHHDRLTFRGVYAFTENFVLPLSHDEVVHGKGSLLAKMPGDEWQKFANLRLLLAYQYTQPGKKLLFMGAEIGQWHEWDHDRSLDWNLLGHRPHAGVLRLVGDLNRCYRRIPALHRLDCDPAGFEWVAQNAEDSVLGYLRLAPGAPSALVVCNFTPVPRHDLLIGVPESGLWREVLNTDAGEYGGSGMGNMGGAEAQPTAGHGLPGTLKIVAPPLACVVFVHQPAAARSGTPGPDDRHRPSAS